MRKLLLPKTLAGVAPWKFLFLAASLLFTYSIPVHAVNHEEAVPADVEAAVEDAAGPIVDYQGLLDHQGDYAPAFAFSYHINSVDLHSNCVGFPHAFRS